MTREDGKLVLTSLTDKALPQETITAIEAMKGDLLIVFLNRLCSVGVEVEFPIKEIDDAGKFVLEMELDTVNKMFRFKTRRKS